MDNRSLLEKVIEEFESLTKDAKRVQTETLKKILEENSEAEYLKKWNLDGRFDPQTYGSCVPLVTHKDLDPYIQKIADGESEGRPMLTQKPITTITITSGTTQGKPKFVPFIDKMIETTMQMSRTSFAFRNREFPIDNGKVLSFMYISKQFTTKGGLLAGTGSANIYRSPEAKKRAHHIPYCSPDEVIFGTDFHQSLYCHLLCGLIFHEEIQVISSGFAHSIVHSFRTFELVWEELCSDIRTGVLSAKITVPSIRTAMDKVLTPNPELADKIYKKCLGLTDWSGLIQEVFPNCKYIYGIMTGSMVPYLKKLRHYAGTVRLVSADYGSSEGWIGANVNPSMPPEMTTYAVLPNIGYFEFLPLREIDVASPDQDDHDLTFYPVEPKPVGLTDVQIGEEYEVVITNFSGLYRYRLGDVVKVMGFHNSTPKLQYVCRRNLIPTINVEKNTEKDLQLSVEAAAKLLAAEKLELVDFTSHVDVVSEPGHYVIYWEVSGEASDAILKECCNCLDKSFFDEGYVSSRKINMIGPLKLRVLRRGTFQKIQDHYVGLGTALYQFKTPRCVGQANHRVLEILCNNVAKSYISAPFD